MYAKTHTRGGATSWAKHLMNQNDNDHVRIVETRHLFTQGLRDMFRDIESSASAQCKKAFFCMEICPAFEERFTAQDMLEASTRMEAEFPELANTARVIVEHEKEGRTHWHITWSRIKDDGKAVCFKIPPAVVAARISYEMNRARGTPQPEGLLNVIERRNHAKAPTIKEHRQAAKQKLNVDNIQELVKKAWETKNPNAAAIKDALFENGFLIAKGDKRGLVLVHTTGEVFSFARMAGVKAAEVKKLFGNPDAYPSVEQTTTLIKRQMELNANAPLVNEIQSIKTKSEASRDKETTADKISLEKLREEQRAEREAIKNLPESEQLEIIKQQRKTMRKVSADNAHNRRFAFYKNIIIGAAMMQASFRKTVKNLPIGWKHICISAYNFLLPDDPLRAMETPLPKLTPELIQERMAKYRFKLATTFSNLADLSRTAKEVLTTSGARIMPKRARGLKGVLARTKSPRLLKALNEQNTILDTPNQNTPTEQPRAVFKRATTINTNTNHAKQTTTPATRPMPRFTP